MKKYHTSVGRNKELNRQKASVLLVIKNLAEIKSTGCTNVACRMVGTCWYCLRVYTALGKLLPPCKSVLTAASGHLLIFDKNARPAAKQACLTAVAVAV